MEIRKIPASPFISMTVKKLNNILHIQSWPVDEVGYAGFFAITAKDQNVIELVEKTNRDSKDNKYDKFVFVQSNGITYIAMDLLIERSSVNRDEILKIVEEGSKVSSWQGHVKFWFRCKEISEQKT